MTAVKWTGPLGAVKANPSGSSGPAGSANQNPHEAPSFFNQGTAFLDPRFQFTDYMSGNRPAFIFPYGKVMTANAAPSTLAANNIAASQSPGAGAINLVSSSGAGITVGQSITRADTGVLVTGLLAIDVTMTPISFSTEGRYQAWDPTKILGRALQIVSGGNDTGINFTISGYDVYGFPMTETQAGANAGAKNFNKAFKYVASVTHTGSVATTVTVGTRDVFGFPMRSDQFADVEIFWNNALITANTGYTAADTTSPATASTTDVRGTYAVQSAADGTKRLVIYQSPISIVSSVFNFTTVNGVFGVAQNTASNNGT